VERMGAAVFYPELEFCTDNGAMIALAGAMRLQSREIETLKLDNKFTINARWDLEMEAIGQEV